MIMSFMTLFLGSFLLIFDHRSGLLEMVPIFLITISMLPMMMLYLRKNDNSKLDSEITNKIDEFDKKIGIKSGDNDEVGKLREQLIMEMKNIRSENIDVSTNKKIDSSNSSLDNVIIIFRNNLNQLESEMQNCSGRANLNLFIGIITTLMAIGVLIYITFNLVVPKEGLNYFYFELAARGSIVIFIEIFSFFFLRLYKNGIDDIKYYQNEMTNLGQKYSALITSIKVDSINEKILIEMVKNERNFKIKKDERIIAENNDRMEYDQIIKLIETINKSK